MRRSGPGKTSMKKSKTPSKFRLYYRLWYKKNKSKQNKQQRQRYRKYSRDPKWVSKRRRRLRRYMRVYNKRPSAQRYMRAYRQRPNVKRSNLISGRKAQERRLLATGVTYNRVVHYAWRKKHPDKTLEYAHRRRAAKGSIGHSFTSAEWMGLKRYYGFRCVCCGKKRPLTPDHVVPVSKRVFGTGTIGNIQPLCRVCNSSKGAWHTTDYRLRKMAKGLHRLYGKR